MIKDILKDGNPYEVNLVIRPRRFGKTLALNMLDCFFDIRKDSSKLFDGLQISNYQDICNEYMNKYPTIFITFKDINGLNFDEAYRTLVYYVTRLFYEFDFLIDAININEEEKNTFLALKSGKIDKTILKDCLYLIIKLASIYYDKKVFLLLDEYDAPLAKASENGYYKEMLDVLKAY